MPAECGASHYSNCTSALGVLWSIGLWFPSSGKIAEVPLSVGARGWQMYNPWLHLWSGSVSLLHQTTFPRLLLALLLGALIGAERQWRQRAAGLRTNTLVCFGAAAFVDRGLRGAPGTT